MREYFWDYYAEDEHPPRLRALPDATIVPLAELYSDEEWKTSRAYNEAFGRYDGRNGLIMLLDGPGGSRITWGSEDPVDAGGWSLSQLDSIARVVPHIRQYARVRSALADAGALGASAAELLGNARTGVVQLDLRKRIVEANARRGSCSCARTGCVPRTESCSSPCRRIMTGISGFWRGRWRASGRRSRAARCRCVGRRSWQTSCCT